MLSDELKEEEMGWPVRNPALATRIAAYMAINDWPTVDPGLYQTGFKRNRITDVDATIEFLMNEVDKVLGDTKKVALVETANIMVWKTHDGYEVYIKAGILDADSRNEVSN